MIQVKPTQYFNTASSGVTAGDGTVSVLSDIWVVKIQKGLGVVIPGRFKLNLKLLDADGVEMGANSEVYFGYRTADDPRRTVPIGAKILYSPYKDLTTAQQRDADYADSVWVDFGYDILPLIEDESLVISCYGVAGAGAGTVDATYCSFEVPFAERSPEDLVAEMAYRRQWWGR